MEWANGQRSSFRVEFTWCCYDIRLCHFRLYFCHLPANITIYVESAIHLDTMSSLAGSSHAIKIQLKCSWHRSRSLIAIQVDRTSVQFFFSLVISFSQYLLSNFVSTFSYFSLAAVALLSLLSAVRFSLVKVFNVIFSPLLFLLFFMQQIE